MVASGRPVANTAAFYGSILNAVTQHMTTAQMWEGIRAQAESLGLGFSPQVLQEVNQLRANAAQVVASSERLSGASTPTTITSELIGRPFYARPPSAQEARPIYEARFQIDYLTPTGPQSGWYRLEYGRDLPNTVARLLADINLYAAEFAGSYGHELIGTGQIMLNAV